MAQRLSILGSTGSIGESTLSVVSQYPDRFQIYALSANSHVQRLYDQCLRYQPEYAVMADENAAAQLETKLKSSGHSVKVLAGSQGLQEIASADTVDVVMAAIVGAAGLLPSLAAAKAGKKLLLANKEALVMSGALFMQSVRQHGAQLLPIDSEHNAVFQCLPGDYASGLAQAGVSRILLTASGGPFRQREVATLADVTPDEACAHPNWRMGRKISVDSATMMNKGLEVIEAHWLFNADAEKIEVVIHPQSIIHSMVQYVDGSVLAQLGNPDMRTPIAHALAWPQRMETEVAELDLVAVAQLQFEAADVTRFPCLDLAYQALRRGGTAAAVLNAANEIAVEAFLQNRVAYLDIPATVEYVLERAQIDEAADLESILAADANARQLAQEFMAQTGKARGVNI